MEKEKILKVIDFWRKTIEVESLHPRAVVEEIHFSGKEVVDIVGPRRAGKSSVLKLLIKKLRAEEQSLFINFEDPYFIENQDPEVIERLVEIFLEYFHPKLKYLFFDEIQNIKQWEKAVRKLSETGRYTVFVTGSSSKLLSRELSSLLTGRHRSYEVFPLHFKEYLQFKGLEFSSQKEVILNQVKIEKHLKNYIREGGFPQSVLSGDEETLKQYYADIVERDILARYEIRQKEILQKMGAFLISNSAKPLSLASMAKTFEISHALAGTYLSYFKEAFLLFDLSLFAYSLKTQAKALKKIYAVDTGLANAVSFRFSEDFGRMIETVVFLHLKRRKGELYYYKTAQNFEVDFLVIQKGKKELIQVCSNLEDAKTKARELRALVAASDELKCKTLKVLSLDHSETEKHEGKTIEFIPLWKWLCIEQDETTSVVSVAPPTTATVVNRAT